MGGRSGVAAERMAGFDGLDEARTNRHRRGLLAETAGESIYDRPARGDAGVVQPLPPVKPRPGRRATFACCPTPSTEHSGDDLSRCRTSPHRDTSVVVMRTGMPDLDDVEGLVALDVDGLLQSVARAGAQVRAVAEAVREGALDPLSPLRPRGVVIVSGAASSRPLRPSSRSRCSPHTPTCRSCACRRCPGGWAHSTWWSSSATTRAIRPLPMRRPAPPDGVPRSSSGAAGRSTA